MMIPDDTPEGTVVVPRWGNSRGTTTSPVDPDRGTVTVKWEYGNREGLENTDRLEVSDDQSKVRPWGRGRGSRA